MQSLKTKDGDLVIALSSDELVIVKQALNEITNGVRWDDSEFETRVGYTRAEVRELLAKISAALTVARND